MTAMAVDVTVGLCSILHAPLDKADTRGATVDPWVVEGVLTSAADLDVVDDLHSSTERLEGRASNADKEQGEDKQ